MIFILLNFSTLCLAELKINLEKFDKTAFPIINFTISIQQNDNSELNPRESDFELMENGVRMSDFRLMDSNMDFDVKNQMIQNLKGLVGNKTDNKFPGKSDLFSSLLELRKQGNQKKKIYSIKYTSKKDIGNNKDITMQLIEIKSGNGIVKRYNALASENKIKQIGTQERLFIPPKMPLPDMNFKPPKMPLPDMDFKPPKIPDFGNNGTDSFKIKAPKAPTIKIPEWK